MNKHKIRKWKDIRDSYTDKLLLGNGASIAVCERFRYQSLYEEASNSGRITKNLGKLFAYFGTRDFEHILRLLREANRINKLLGIRESNTFTSYKSLREALVETISSIHPEYNAVEGYLLAIANFMKQFHTVLSLNYDLIVYWAMLKGNDKYGKWFKDAFVNDGKFENDFDYLYTPQEANGATLVFYPHGNLILATEVFGDEIKLSRLDEEVYLLDTIIYKWRRGNYIPLFVSEGSTSDKLDAIQRSNYLDTVYDYALGQSSESLVIYGWSFRNEDEHILKALVDAEPKRVAVSVHASTEDTETYCERVEYLITNMRRKLRKTQVCHIAFFDARSEGCWNN